MNTEILVYIQIRIDINRFVAEWTHIDLFVFLLICHTLMRFDRGVVSAEYFSTVLALDGQPVLLFTDVDGAVFAYILIEHLK
jgi:hypothetical protein